MVEVSPIQAEALTGLVAALNVAGDGDMEKGIKVMTGVLKLVRTTGCDDPLDGLEEIREALASAHKVKNMAKFTRWLVLAALGVVVAGSQFVEAIGKIAAALRSTGRAP